MRYDRYSALCLVTVALLFGVADRSSAQSFTPAGARFTQVSTQAVPLVPLRGYKSLAGRQTVYASHSGKQLSVLTLICADPASAKMTIAKYSSDLHCLGGVTDESIPAAGRTWIGFHAGAQGWIVAGRVGSVLTIMASKDEDTLIGALSGASKSFREACDQDTSASVPIYLDKFDKYGWSFWYADGWTPPGQETTFDPIKGDLEYAKSVGVGLQIAPEPEQIDTAERTPNLASEGWLIDANRMLNVPTFIQFQNATVGGLWLANKYPDQMEQRMPGFVGDYYGNFGTWQGGGPAHISFDSGAAEDIQNDTMARTVRHYASYPNITGYLEPHGETGQDPVSLFLEYGPVADVNYRKYLASIYHDPQTVDRRWYGGSGKIKTWDDVHLQEIATFLGWGPEAVDLGGDWKLGYEDVISTGELASWGSTNLDDGKWPTVREPGNDLLYLLPKKPAVMRRTFTLSSDDLAREVAGGNTYLYVWDLNTGYPKTVSANINGHALPDHAFVWATPDIAIFDVTGDLVAGDNKLALRLPSGFLGYRVYLSPDPPKNYPDLGAQLNAQWQDFREFNSWARAEQVRRSIEAIRREDPNRHIKLMAPGANVDEERELAQDYGGSFHDTGGMAGFWNDSLPELMRGAGRPFTVEPGGPAGNVHDLMQMFGMFTTEGVNAVDYFMHIGNITYNPAMKQWFEDNQPMVHLIGKYHSPTATVAVLHDGSSARLTGFPFRGYGRATNILDWAVEDHLSCPHDDLTQLDFERGNASRYSLIIDANSSVMDDKLIDQIGEWVRAGGTFVTFGMTGRDTPESPNSWPISRLTGYNVSHICDFDADGDPQQWEVVKPAPGQTVLSDPAWSKNNYSGAGMKLVKVAPDCRDVLMWPDGTVAAGVRPLGKGYVLDLGVRFHRGSLLWSWDEPTGVLLADVLKWRRDYVVRPRARRCQTVPFVSNNGLYNVYLVWANNLDEPRQLPLHVPGPDAPATVRDVLTGAIIPGQRNGDDTMYDGMPMVPGQTRAYLGMRNQIISAPLEWAKLQQMWWAGTTAPAPAPALPPPSPNHLDLYTDWAVKTFGQAFDVAAALTADDSKWPRKVMGMWNYPDSPGATRGVARRTFQIPWQWQGHGRIWWWMVSTDTLDLRPPYDGQVYLDGKLVWDSKGQMYAMAAADMTDALPSGTHTFTLVAHSTRPPVGFGAETWLEFLPDPEARQDLSGKWNSSADGLVYTSQSSIPGDNPPQFEQRTFTPEPAEVGKNIVLYLDTGNQLCYTSGILINNRYIGRQMPRGGHVSFNLTPYVQPGQENTLTLIGANGLKTIELRYYDPAVYP